MSKGFVYVMINTSYEGLVKIGKTTKSPSDRAKELSCATGVPTPFIVVYYREFYNCDKAEEIAHDILTSKGYRINSSREFFAVGIPEAINVILSLPDDEKVDEFIVTSIGNDTPNMGELYFNEAEKHHFGLDGTFQDLDLALSNYEKSASLGYRYAYKRIGIILKKNNILGAIRAFQNGARVGDNMCYAELGNTYMDSSHQYYNEYNASLAWSKFFDFAQERYAVNEWDNDNEIVDYICSYLLGVIKPGESINSQHELFIARCREKIVERIHRHIEILKSKYPSGDFLIHRFEKVLSYIIEVEERNLVSISDKEELSRNYFHIAERYFLGIGREVGFIKALGYYKKSAELGFRLANARIGSIWMLKGNKDKAFQVWSDFFNNVEESLVTSEEKELFMRGLSIIISSIIDNNITPSLGFNIYTFANKYGLYDYCVNNGNREQIKYRQSLLKECIQDSYNPVTINKIRRFLNMYK